MSKRTKWIIITVVLAIVLALSIFTAGVYTGVQLATKIFDIQRFLSTSNLGRDAFDAYHEEPPEVAIWALQRLAKELEWQLAQERELLWTRKDMTQFDLMQVHRRLAKLYSKQNDPKSDYHQAEALRLFHERAEEIDPDADPERYFELLDKRDAGEKIDWEALKREKRSRDAHENIP